VSQSLAWLSEAFQRSGIQPSVGSRLWAILRDAGVEPLGMLGVQPHFGPNDSAGPGLLAGIVRTVLPLIEQTGVATRQQVAAETLHDRLAAEMTPTAQYGPTRSCSVPGGTHLSSRNRRTALKSVPVIVETDDWLI
jgi:hypothetical protein